MPDNLEDPLSARLTALLRVMADAPDANSVAAAACYGLLSPYRPDNTLVYAAREQTRTFELVAHAGFPADLVRLYGHVAFDTASPLNPAYVDGVETFIARTVVVEQYPVAAAALRTRERPYVGETGYFPLRHRGIAFGVVSAHFPQPPDRSWEFHRAIEALLAALGVWAWQYSSSTPSVLLSNRPGDHRMVSDRQRQVLVLVRDGLTNLEIAQRLNFSEKTIKADLTALYRLLGATGREDLIARAERSGLPGGEA